MNLLNIVCEHFSSPDMAHKLDMIAEFGGGFELWFQMETIVALIDSEIYASVIGKTGFDADIIVRDCERELGVELRCGSTRNINNAFVDHPNSDLYLFLLRNAYEAFPKLCKQIVDRDYNHKKINSDWILVLSKNSDTSKN
ncbi:MAG: hypothetical protein ABSF44_06895 [Candidatus Bathyarchaeia archaeon]